MKELMKKTGWVASTVRLHLIRLLEHEVACKVDMTPRRLKGKRQIDYGRSVRVGYRLVEA